MTKKCFERDWGHSKISNLIKNQQDQEKAKAILFENYKNIKEIYKYFAAWSPIGGIICLIQMYGLLVSILLQSFVIKQSLFVNSFLQKLLILHLLQQIQCQGLIGKVTTKYLNVALWGFSLWKPLFDLLMKSTEKMVFVRQYPIAFQLLFNSIWSRFS